MTETIVTQHESTAVIQPGGDIVAASVGDLRSVLRDVVGRGAKEVTLDLSGVQMIDSAGIGLLVAAHNSLRKAGGTLAVTEASQEIFNLLRTMRMHQHFSVSGQ